TACGLIFLCLQRKGWCLELLTSPSGRRLRCVIFATAQPAQPCPSTGQRRHDCGKTTYVDKGK
uniref:Uncharacterized protein n=1 Tax=Corvus moneduloides TaxID=1196302 RepID=A0A8C3ENZ3_CORMO